MRRNRRTLKGKFKDLISRVKTLVFGRRSGLDIDNILSPPSWRERKIQNQLIDKQYEESLRAKDPHWSDKYDKDFKKMEKEVIRVRESHD